MFFIYDPAGNKVTVADKAQRALLLTKEGWSVKIKKQKSSAKKAVEK